MRRVQMVFAAVLLLFFGGCRIPLSDGSRIEQAGKYSVEFSENFDQRLREKALSAIGSQGTEEPVLIDLEIDESPTAPRFSILDHTHIIVETNPPQYVIIYKWVGSPLGCKVLKYIAVYCYAIDCNWAGLRLVSTWYVPLCPM